MKIGVTWKEGMQFEGRVDGHTVLMDVKPPLGQDRGATPKELVAMGLGGCTSMDVVALLKKNKQPLKAFHIDVEIVSSSGGHPIVFQKAILTFVAEGEIDAEILKDTVRLSQTKYCGVSAMLSKALLIEYRIILNGKEVGAGVAAF